MKKELLLNTEIKEAFAPVSNNGTAITGNIIKRDEFLSALLGLQIGAVTGTPTDLAGTLTVYSGNTVDDEDTPTSITDEVASTEYVLAIAAAQAGDVESFIDIDLTGLGVWVRAELDLTFTGGTSPEALVASQWVLGDPRESEQVTAAQNA